MSGQGCEQHADQGLPGVAPIVLLINVGRHNVIYCTPASCVTPRVCECVTMCDRVLPCVTVHDGV